MYLVEDLYKEHAKALALKLAAGEKGLDRRIVLPEAHRPGLSLSGYLKHHASKRILIFGNVEIKYLLELTPTIRTERLMNLIGPSCPTPAVIIARRLKPPIELLACCEKQQIPLFRSLMSTTHLLNKLNMLLSEQFSPNINCHGTFVEVFGVGILIQGDSSVGKSESALGLIERGHRLITDDIVKVRKKEPGYLEGYGAELTKHLMEIRGIGIINVGHLYGAVCVRDNKSIDIVVKLEAWDDKNFYDRIGLEEKHCVILGIKIPFHILPVKPGRDIVLLLETIALNHRLKGMGYHSAKEFQAKLLEIIASKQKKRRRSEVSSQN